MVALVIAWDIRLSRHHSLDEQARGPAPTFLLHVYVQRISNMGTRRAPLRAGRPYSTSQLIQVKFWISVLMGDTGYEDTIIIYDIQN